MTTALQQQIAARLKQARLRAGFRTASDFIRHFGLKESVYNSHESGRRGIPLDTLRRYAGVLKTPYSWLILGEGYEEPMTVEVVGYVGAGAEIRPIDDHPLGAGIETVEAPPNVEPSSVVAVRIRGDSMYPAYNDGDVIYYQKHAAELQDCYNRDCVVKLLDGPTMVKRVERGSGPDRVTLISHNAPPITDMRVEWISRVEWVKKRSYRLRVERMSLMARYTQGLIYFC